MDVWLDLLPWFGAMLLLIVASGFFSASEAALFSLQDADRRKLSQGGRGQRAAVELLEDPERLLIAVLFCNLVVNILYFTVTSMVGIRLEKNSDLGSSAAIGFTVVSLFTIIFCSEMLPKSIAVISPTRVSTLLALPMTAALRLVGPLLPALRAVNRVSQRAIWPNFEQESQLEFGDLERAIVLSTDDAELAEQERAMLQNIVMLSDIRIDEWMRPRSQFLAFSPPVSLTDLDGQMPPGGYLLITEPNSEEVEKSINLTTATELAPEHLEHHATPVLYVPWSATVAHAMEQMMQKQREVAAVVNEFGDTIGILTFEDLLDTIFTFSPSRSKRLLDRNPIHPISRDKWLVAGVTSLRRLGRYLNVDIPPSKSITIAGLIQESLKGLARVGDEGEWGPFRFRVLEVPHRGHMLIELTVIREEEEAGG